MMDDPRQVGEQLVAHLIRVNAGKPWHGPSRTALLADVPAAVAAWQPGAGAHSIWETVLHMRSWTSEVAHRALGDSSFDDEVPRDGEWPAVGDTSEASWLAARASLEAALQELVRVIRSLPPERFGQRVGATPDNPAGTGITHHEMLSSLAEHDLYHAGQISLLNRLARSALGLGDG
jgi:uncharacterized damage-inducible protein DinB